jgi:hypothetical protein
MDLTLKDRVTSALTPAYEPTRISAARSVPFIHSLGPAFRHRGGPHAFFAVWADRSRTRSSLDDPLLHTRTTLLQGNPKCSTLPDNQLFDRVEKSTKCSSTTLIGKRATIVRPDGSAIVWLRTTQLPLGGRRT